MPNRISWLRSHTLTGAEEESTVTAQEANETDQASTESGTDSDNNTTSVATIPPVDRSLEDARKEAAKYRKRAQAAEKKLEDAAAEKLSETEKAVARAEAADQRAAEAESRLQKIEVETVVSRAASSLKFNDPDDALRMLDLSALEYDEDTGLPVKSSVNKALKKLVETKPYLTTAVDFGSADGGSSGDAKKMTQADRVKKYEEEFQKRGYVPVQ